MRIRRFNESYKEIDHDEWMEMKPEDIGQYECSKLEEFAKSLGEKWSIRYEVHRFKIDGETISYKVAKLIRKEPTKGSSIIWTEHGEKTVPGYREYTCCEIEQSEDKWLVLTFNNSPYFDTLEQDPPIIKCETIQDAIQYLTYLVTPPTSVNEKLDTNKINFITDKFLEVADDLGLEEVNEDDTSLTQDGFFYIPDESKNYWSVHHNKIMNELVITMVFDRSQIFNGNYTQENLVTSSYEEALERVKKYMEYINKIGYSSYLECPGRFQLHRHNMLLTIKDTKFIKTIHPRWGSKYDIKGYVGGSTNKFRLD